MKPRTFKVGVLDVEVTVDRGQRGTIASRSFRGKGVQKAGNFGAWNDIGEFLEDLDFEFVVLPRLVDAALANMGTFSVEIAFDEHIGWTTVLCAGDPWFLGHGLYDFVEEKLSNGVRANFVTDLPAPLTELVTVIGQGRMSDDRTLRITLYNVRPGMATPRFPRPHRFRGRMVGERVPEELDLLFWRFEDEGEEEEPEYDEYDEDGFDPDYYFDGILGTMVINGVPYDGPFPDDFDHSP